MASKILAAKNAAIGADRPGTPRLLSIVATCLSLGFSVQTSVAGGLPVFDGANVVQTTVTAVEEVAQTLKQIEQYKTQLDQYMDQLRNTKIPGSFIWDQAQKTMSSLRKSIDTLNYYKQQLGSIDGYVRKFKDAATYSNFLCYKNNSCTAAEWAQINSDQYLGSESQKKATDALFKGLDKQQDAMQADAATLEGLQAAAQSAEGRMQAIQYANQLASQQANQLLQIRGLLVAQQNVIATRFQALADNEAKQQAASNKHYAVPPLEKRPTPKGY